MRRHAVFALPMLLTMLAGGCGSTPAPDYPALTGRRVQGVAVVAGGTVPYRVGAYELVFPERAGSHARRAALVVDLFGARGRVQGFAEWVRAGGQTETYAVGGWASQRAVDGQVLTVFDLALNSLESRPARAADRAPVDIRVVVDEGSGDVTLTRRR